MFNMIGPENSFNHEQIVTLENREILFSEGDESREMYVIRKGKVEVVKETKGGEDVQLAIIPKGSFFGEMALLNSEPRSATVRAIGEVELLKISPGGFTLKIRRDPTFAFEMLQKLSQRIRSTNDQLLDAVKNNNLSKDSLLNIIDEQKSGVN